MVTSSRESRREVGGLPEDALHQLLTSAFPARFPLEAFLGTPATPWPPSSGVVGQPGQCCYRDRRAGVPAAPGLNTANLESGSNLKFDSSLGTLKTPKECRLLEQIHLKGMYFPLVSESCTHGLCYYRLSQAGRDVTW